MQRLELEYSNVKPAYNATLSQWSTNENKQT